MSASILIGYWVEKTARKITHCPSYYAADSETLETIPGRYPIRLTFEGGYDCPMPYWLVGSIDTTRIEGALYSGFGGVNFASTPLPVGVKVQYHIQAYDYQLGKMVESGNVELLPGMECWAEGDHAKRIDYARQLGWDKIMEMGKMG